MKNQKRMVAVIAASGLALGSMPGIASAQSVEIGLGVGAEVGSVAVGVALGSTGDVDSSGGTGSGQLAGSLEDLFDGGSSNGGSSNLGSSGNTIGGSVTDIVGSSSGSEAAVGAALAIGSLAAVGVGVHSVANAGVQLPPLPAINVGAVCNLPQEAIDFLKDNGSMERQECEPEEQPAP